jgi:hypothetical protein
MATTYDLLTVLPGLQVTASEILTHEQAVVAKLQAQYPTLDLRPGSGLRDTLIRPAAVHQALMAKSLEQYNTDRYLQNATDSSDTAVVDALLSNFFLSRNLGTVAQVEVRLRFHPRILDSRTSSITVDPSMFFSVDNLNLFSPAGTFNIAVSDLSLYTSGVDTYHYADILCQSVGQGEAFNVPAGTEFLYFSLINNYFLGASVLYLATESSAAETNSEFIARAPTAISTRNLINVPSISYNIATLPFVRYERSVGMGDYEMVRDYVEIPTVSGVLQAHRGGMVDIYVRSTLASAVVLIPLEDPQTVLTGLPPIVDIWYSDETPETDIAGNLVDGSLSVLPGTPGDRVGFYDENYLPSALQERRYGLSSLQKLVLSVPYQPDSAIVAKVLFWQGLDSVQAYLSSSESRMMSGSQICRGFAVVHTSLALFVNDPDPGDDSLATTAAEACQAVLDAKIPGSELLPLDLILAVREALPDLRLDLRADLTLTLYDGSGQYYTVTIPSAVEPVTPDYISTLGGRTSEAEEDGDKIKNAFVYHMKEVTFSWS